MLQLFVQDVARWIVPQQVADPREVNLKRTLKLLNYHMPLRAMFWFRLGSWLVQKRVPLAKGYFYRLIFRRFGMEISPGAEIGGGFYIAHPIGSVISPKRIGKNCTIIHSVTIGMRNEWAFPDIGDNVFIGAGARVLGGIRIGNNAVIGANAVVIHDVPDGATVVGIPAKVIKMRDNSEV
ncbi:MAG TPA: serine O-acetyltransferase [Anaerolineales bacterium]|nr:serine O-acetyltransferase [Anaerolineales bacterium]